MKFINEIRRIKAIWNINFSFLFNGVKHCHQCEGYFTRFGVSTGDFGTNCKRCLEKLKEEYDSRS